MNQLDIGKNKVVRLSSRRAKAPLTLALFLVLAGCSADPGLVAYRQGDQAGSLGQVQAGDTPVAAFALGLMLYKGEGGVPTLRRQLSGFAKRRSWDTRGRSIIWRCFT